MGVFRQPLHNCEKLCQLVKFIFSVMTILYHRNAPVVERYLSNQLKC
jgi:hypothetical protein